MEQTEQISNVENKIEQKINQIQKIEYTLLDIDLNKLSGKIRFLLLMVLIGVVFSLLGDVLCLVTFNASGITCILLGFAFICLGFIVTIYKFCIEQNKEKKILKNEFKHRK